MGYEYQTNWIPGGKFGVYVKLFVRFLQFVLGVTIAGVYGAAVGSSIKHGNGYSNEFGFATVVGGLTALTALFYLLPKVKAFCYFYVDFLYVLLFAVVIGIFGKAYFNPKIPVGITKAAAAVTVKGPSVQQMKMMAWIDVIDGILWLLTALFSLFLFLKVKGTVKKQAQTELQGQV